jgi:predicted transglutaminase-like cysteine proteinase
MMSILAQGARIFFIVVLICCRHSYADAPPSGPSRASEAYLGGMPADQPASDDASGTPVLSRLSSSTAGLTDRRQNPATPSPVGVPALAVLSHEYSAKWAELQSRIAAEERTLEACRSGDGPCSAAARRFLSIVELGRARQGRAWLGEINRAVNLSIKPVSDWVQHGVADFWSAPLATLRTGAGDCEDYAIVKYVALRESGILPDDLRLVIVRDIKRKTDHVVLAVRHDAEWLILDNRTLIMVNAREARHYYPLLVADHRGVRELGIAQLPLFGF